MDGIGTNRVGTALVAVLRMDAGEEALAGLRVDLLEQVFSGGVATVVIDLSGVEIIDTHLVSQINQLAGAVHLMSARTVLAGLRPQAAIVLTELGQHFRGVAMAASVRSALRQDPSPPPERRGAW